MPSAKNKAWFKELRDQVITAMHEMNSPVRHIAHCTELRPQDVMSAFKRLKLKKRRCDSNKPVA